MGIVLLWAQQLLIWYPLLASFFSERTRNRVLVASAGIALIGAFGVARSNLLISREDFLAGTFEEINPRYVRIFNSETVDPSRIEKDLIEFSQ
jgi:hypothetical protein